MLATQKSEARRGKMEIIIITYHHPIPCIIFLYISDPITVLLKQHCVFVQPEQRFRINSSLSSLSRQLWKQFPRCNRIRTLPRGSREAAALCHRKQHAGLITIDDELTRKIGGLVHSRWDDHELQKSFAQKRAVKMEITIAKAKRRVLPQPNTNRDYNRPTEDRFSSSPLLFFASTAFCLSNESDPLFSHSFVGSEWIPYVLRVARPVFSNGL